MNARSEFRAVAKSGGDGVLETSRRFQIASPASWSPGLRPTRGSGLGAAAEAAGAGADAPPPVEEAQEAVAPRPKAMVQKRTKDRTVAIMRV